MDKKEYAKEELPPFFWQWLDNISAQNKE